jgi:hypothetical protein
MKQAINVHVPKWLHTSAKVLAAEEETTVLALVIEGLISVLESRGRLPHHKAPKGSAIASR